MKYLTNNAKDYDFVKYQTKKEGDGFVNSLILSTITMKQQYLKYRDVLCVCEFNLQDSRFGL